MPAANEDYISITESRIKELIEGIEAAGSQKYHVEKFFGTFDPNALYAFVQNKLNTTNGSVFIRANDDDPEVQDTIGTLYKVRLPIECLVAYPAMKENQINNNTRFTSEMMKDIRSALITQRVNFSDQTKRIRYDGSASLFRDDQIDAQIVRFVLEGVVVDFNNSI